MAQCSLGHPPSWTCSACPTAGQRAPPAPAHFNARGELIPYVIIPEAHGVALVPEEDALMKAVPGSPDTDLDDDMGMDLELAYPDDEVRGSLIYLQRSSSVSVGEDALPFHFFGVRLSQPARASNGSVSARSPSLDASSRCNAPPALTPCVVRPVDDLACFGHWRHYCLDSLSTRWLHLRTEEQLPSWGISLVYSFVALRA
ncbi:hypothetical protein DFH06DRAFT_738998 [Mycena polygramma]|nr:hypothetical protein DFH06DRAFT_738998 [Mycena polygramma]